MHSTSYAESIVLWSMVFFFRRDESDDVVTRLGVCWCCLCPLTCCFFLSVFITVSHFPFSLLLHPPPLSASLSLSACDASLGHPPSVLMNDQVVPQKRMISYWVQSPDGWVNVTGQGKKTKGDKKYILLLHGSGDFTKWPKTTLRRANGVFSGEQEIDGRANHGQKWLHNGISPLGRRPSLQLHSTGGSFSSPSLSLLSDEARSKNHTEKRAHEKKARKGNPKEGQRF